MPSLVPDQSQLTYYPEFEVYRDSLGNAYEYGPNGNLRAVQTTNASDPYNIKTGSFDAVFEEIAPGINQKISQTQTSGESWIETVEKGLPPIDIASYSGIGVNVGLSPATRNLLIYGGIALVAVIFLTRGR